MINRVSELHQMLKKVYPLVIYMSCLMFRSLHLFYYELIFKPIFWLSVLSLVKWFYYLWTLFSFYGIYVFNAEYLSGNTGGSSWGISSIFGGGDSRMTVKENMASKPQTEPIHSVKHSFSMIHLREVCVHDTFNVSLSLINMFHG